MLSADRPSFEPLCGELSKRPVVRQKHGHRDRLTAYLTIFDIRLSAGGQINPHREHFRAVGTIHINELFEFIAPGLLSWLKDGLESKLLVNVIWF